MLAVVAVSMEMPPPAHAQDSTDKIARLVDDRLSGKEARAIAQSLKRAPSLSSLPPLQVELLLEGLVHARTKFRYEKETVKALDTLALETLSDCDPEGHILGKNLKLIIENPNYLRREESFRTILQFLLEAHIQPGEFFDAIRILDPDELEDRDLIERNADLMRKFSIAWPQSTQPVSAEVTQSVSALSGPWSQLAEDQIVRYVRVLGDVLGSAPVRSAVDYATALELIGQKEVLSAMAQRVGTWLNKGKYEAIIAFAACIDALVISDIAQGLSPQLKLIGEDQRAQSFFAVVSAFSHIEDLTAKEICEKAADELFHLNPLAITVRVIRIAQEQTDGLVQDPHQLSLLAELYRYYESQAKLLEMKAAEPLQIPAYVYQDPLSPAKVAKKLQVFAGLNPDDSVRLSPAIVTLQYYLQTGRIPEDSDFRGFVLAEAAKKIPHLLLVALWNQYLDRIGEWMVRPDLQATEAKVFADWIFAASLQGDRLEKAYSFLFAASSNFKEADPAAVALRLSAADLLKNQDRAGNVLADYLAQVLMARREEQNLRELQDILKTFQAARYFPIAARKAIRDFDFQDPEIRTLLQAIVDDHFPTSPPPADPSSEDHAAPARSAVRMYNPTIR